MTSIPSTVFTASTRQPRHSEWTELSQDKIRDVIQKNNDALGNRNWLTTWVDYLQLKEDLSKDGFDKIFESLEENNIKSERLIELIELWNGAYSLASGRSVFFCLDCQPCFMSSVFFEENFSNFRKI